MPIPGVARAPLACSWLRVLAAGYLLGYASVSLQSRGGLWGYSFENRHGRTRVGFFIGFLTRRRPRSPLRLETPECVVFAFVRPVAGRRHQRLVRREGSAFRRAYDLLTKYTARRPRFEFHPQAAPALVRRVPLAEFPARQREKYARNFFIETLALLVRSRLPEDLLAVRGVGR